MKNLTVVAVLLLAVFTVSCEEESKEVTKSAVVIPSIRRDPAVIDNIATASRTNVNNRHIGFYSRASRQRPSKPYSPSRRKKRPSKYGRKRPMKRLPSKYKHVHKYRKGHHSHSRRTPKPMLTYLKNPRPIYSKHKPYSPYIPQEPAGFGEPPADHFSVNNPKHSYAEPPVDSYGKPIRFNAPTKSPKYSYNELDYSRDQINDPQQEFPPRDYEGHPSVQEFAVNSDLSYEMDHSPKTLSQGYGSSYIAGQNNFKLPSLTYDSNAHSDESFEEPRRPFRYHHLTKPYNVHQKDPKFSASKINQYSVKGPFNPSTEKYDHEIIVGGQYAEPPARYVSNFRPSAPVYSGDDTFLSPGKIPSDMEESASSLHSSYVNYKNSNMAFSPQNLNDAFSIATY